MKLNNKYLPFLSTIGTGKLFFTENDLACHAVFREFSGDGIRLMLRFSGHECVLWLSEFQLSRWCNELFPYSDCKTVPEDTLKLMILWALNDLLTEHELLIENIEFISLAQDVYPVIELSNGIFYLDIILLDLSILSLLSIINDKWEFSPYSDIIDFDGYIVLGWSDYPVSQLRVGDALRIYYLDDSHENNYWLVVNNPIAQLSFCNDLFKCSCVYDPGPLRLIEEDTPEQRIYCVAGSMNLSLSMLENASAGEHIFVNHYRFFGGCKLMQDSILFANGVIVKINNDFYFIINNLHENFGNNSN